MTLYRRFKSHVRTVIRGTDFKFLNAKHDAFDFFYQFLTQKCFDKYQELATKLKSTFCIIKFYRERVHRYIYI